MEVLQAFGLVSLITVGCLLLGAVLAEVHTRINRWRVSKKTFTCVLCGREGLGRTFRGVEYGIQPFCREGGACFERAVERELRKAAP